MGAIYAETHFKGRQRSVAELFLQHCIGEGIRPIDVKEAGLSQVSMGGDGKILVDGAVIDEETVTDVLLVTPIDRSGWCVVYCSRHQLGDLLIDLLGRPCPVSEPETWEAHLGIEVAIHGFLNQDTHERGWVLRRGGERTGATRVDVLDGPPGMDLSNAFTEVGRLFGSVNLDLALRRLLSVSRPSDIDEHKLLWAERPTSEA